MPKNLFLYLALACFVGLIAIFVVDGYMGIYDTVYITTGEQSLKVEADSWQQGGPVYAPSPGLVPAEEGRNAYYIYVNREEPISFDYEIDNRKFSTYQADIEVSVWRRQEKVRDLISQPVSIAAFDKGKSAWVVNNTELVPKDILPEQSYQYTVIIKRGEIERKLIVNINPLPYPAKPIPVVPVPAR